jgi:caffeoyl-CoA O-methyltransferase
MAADDRSAWLDPALATYVAEHTDRPDDLQRRLIAETAERFGSRAGMQIGSTQGAFMAMLVQLMGARRALELGTFTGYSALCIARALPDDGRLLCCDVSEEWTSVARSYWAEAGVEHKIDLHLGPALETLAELPEEEQFDLAFIDADKLGYLAYIGKILPRLRAGGLIMVDNTLWSGAVADPQNHDATTEMMRSFNDAVARDPQVSCVLLPIGDGLTLLRKR